jgi:predicted phage terminase large subunit-like protein
MPTYEKANHLILVSEKLEALEAGKCKRLMLFMPPRHGKSELCSIRFPAYYLGRNQQKQVIGCSYAENLAYTFSYAIRETISTNAYQRLWKVELDTSGAVRWQLAGKENKRSSYIAAGVGGGITGEGADLLIIDDPVKNAEEAESEVYREKVYQWYTTTARTRLQPDASIVLIMTRWHQADLAGKLLEDARRDPQADQWEVINLPALKEDKALWTERYPVPTLINIRATIGSRAFESLYQGNPTAAQGDVFKREWWKYYKVRPPFKRIIHSWDTAYKEKTTSDYSVCTVWGVTDNGYYLLEVLRERLELPELKRMCIAAYDRDKPSAVYIEDAASGQSLIQELKRETRLPIIPVKVDKDKSIRAYAVTPLIEAGRVFLPEYAQWLHDYVEELSAFPNGEHDDQVDSTTQALRQMANPATYGFGFSGENEWESENQ